VALFSPLGGGLLTGKYRRGSEGRASSIPGLVQAEDTPQKTAILDEVIALAGETGATPGQVALTWLRAKGTAAATGHVTITGPRTLGQLQEYPRLP
jgi:aryl-alcohol dehydrogenase-like predicted oxidoreductase